MSNSKHNSDAGTKLPSPSGSEYCLSYGLKIMADAQHQIVKTCAGQRRSKLPASHKSTPKSCGHWTLETNRVQPAIEEIDKVREHNPRGTLVPASPKVSDPYVPCHWNSVARPGVTKLQGKECL